MNESPRKWTTNVGGGNASPPRNREIDRSNSTPPLTPPPVDLADLWAPQGDGWVMNRDGWMSRFLVSLLLIHERIVDFAFVLVSWFVPCVAWCSPVLCLGLCLPWLAFNTCGVKIGCHPWVTTWKDQDYTKKVLRNSYPCRWSFWCHLGVFSFLSIHNHPRALRLHCHSEWLDHREVFTCCTIPGILVSARVRPIDSIAYFSPFHAVMTRHLAIMWNPGYYPSVQ